MITFDTDPVPGENSRVGLPAGGSHIQPTANSQQPTANSQLSRKPSFPINNHGLSLTGVLVAAGMAGGLALLLAQLSRQQMVEQKRAETGVEVTGLHNWLLTGRFSKSSR